VGFFGIVIVFYNEKNIMEKKTYHNLEKTRFVNLMVGFCYVTGIVLATFSYGKTEEVKRKYKSDTFNTSNLYVESKEKPKEVEKQKETTQPQQSTQVKETINLNDDLTTNINKNITEDKPSLDLGLPKGDTTVIVDNSVPVIAPDKVEDYPDVEAEFPGGYEEWKKYLLNELEYPEISMEMGDQGIVYVSFVIEIDGTVSDVKVLKGVTIDIDREAKRVIRNSPKWLPGRIAKSNVRTRLSIPINFVLQ
jgi:protein TonB